MRIGLLRHFPVEEQFPQGLMTAAELQAWRQRYDSSPAVTGPFELGAVQWAACLSSDLARAMTTASTVFEGQVESTALLREGEFAEFKTGNLRLPVWMWRWILRVSWMTGHQSQREKRDDFRQRVAAVANLLEARKQDVLVVSHAGMMLYLSRELRARGFSGPKLGVPRHAFLYTYERR